MKALILGYKNHNLGDDLFFIHLISSFPSCCFLFEDDFGGYYSRLFAGFTNVQILDPAKISFIRKICWKLKALLNHESKGQLFDLYLSKTKVEVDLIIRIGGSLFIEPTNNILRSERQFECIRSYFGSIPMVYVGCNYGPSHSELFYESVRRRISLCYDVCFRDSFSYNLFKDIPSVRYAPDIIFGYKINHSQSAITNSLGVSLVDLSARADLRMFENRYLHSIADYIISSKCSVVRLFDFCENEGDINAISKLLSRLSKQNKCIIEVVRYECNPDYFLDSFSQMETIIATRFHAMVLSLLFNRVTIPVTYSDKMVNVINDLPRKLEYVSCQEISCDMLKQIKMNYSHLDITRMKVESAKQFDVIGKIFSNK